MNAAARHVQVWCFRYEAWEPAELVARAWLMNAEERHRYTRLRYERDRLLFLATRVLARSVLASHVGVPAAEVAFRKGPHGKPELVRAPSGPAPSFNLSNTRGLAVLAVSLDGCEVGVDAEAIERELSPESLGRSFTVAERATLQAAPEASRTRLLLEHWTLKESYLKARGFGLSVEPDSIEVRRSGGGYRLSLSPALDDEGDGVCCAVLDVSERHVLSLVARTGGAPLEISNYEFTLGSQHGVAPAPQDADSVRHGDA